MNRLQYAPAGLPERATQIVERYIDLIDFEPQDSALLALLATAEVMAIDLAKQLEDNGIISVDGAHRDTQRRSAVFVAWRQAVDTIRTLQTELNITPRMRAKMGKAEATDVSLEQYLYAGSN